MKKKITELTVKIPLVTEEDLLHNELNMYLLYLEAGIFISNKDKEFSHSELDIIQFYGIINRIQSCFKSIRQACNFISRRPTIKYLDKNEEMTIIDYYNYHYDVVVHKLNTIRDLSFKLINKVFNLNLSDRNCNWNNIKSNNLITIPGIIDIQTLYYYLMLEVERERNESTHNGFIKAKIFDDLNDIVTLSLLNRLKKVPKEIVGYDPLTKGTYYDSQLRKEKKELLKKIDNYKVMSLFCINVLTCCMSNKYKSSIPTDLSTKYSSFIQKANYQIDNYGKKVNKLKFLFPFLEINDKSIEYLKGNGKKGNYKLIVSIVNV